MALVTLSSTIAAKDLNDNFNDKTATINANVLLGKKDFQYDLEAFDVDNSAANVPKQTLDFTPPDDLEVRVMGLFTSSVSAVPLITLTLTAIVINAAGVVESVPNYLQGQTVVVTCQDVVGDANGTRLNRQASSTAKIFLKAGITYRMQLTSTSATVTDYVQAFLCCRTRRRRQ